ncbi:hypothetical protein KFE80_03390 [bacterium SCSIO 12696]|nr:hypothetical protein KFE80_03390 [bacterium SCSIO 12696]
MSVKINSERRGIGLRSIRLPLLVSLLPMALTLPATAAKDDAEKWYQVEVIIFQQTDHYGQEQPRKDVTLQYPSNHLELFDPNQVIEEADSQENGLEGDSEVIEIIEQAPPEATPSILLTAEPEQPQAEQEQPFQILESDQRQLNNYATALRRRSGYQVLYHQAWRQPGIGSAQAPWILVRAGDRYGEHFELEGSLRLVRSRYLHMETNLWLSRFVENLELDTQPNFEGTEGAENVWPLLPEYPIAPPETTIEVLEDNTDNPFESTTEQSLAIGIGELSLEASEAPLFQIGEQEFIEPYKVNEVNLFKASRRMRRDELHYIDHPKMGVLVQVKHYEVPEPKLEKPEVIPTPLLQSNR